MGIPIFFFSFLSFSISFLSAMSMHSFQERTERPSFFRQISTDAPFGCRMTILCSLYAALLLRRLLTSSSLLLPAGPQPHGFPWRSPHPLSCVVPPSAILLSGSSGRAGTQRTQGSVLELSVAGPLSTLTPCLLVCGGFGGGCWKFGGGLSSLCLQPPL